MNRDQILATGRRTIELEAGSIAGLLAFLNDDFVQAVEAVYQCKGRLVISGIGKSAIVAQKIVATLNSTGTPALFLHAADAIHGDLGMVQETDIVLIISKSGESPEIKVLVPLIKNFGNTLLAMVGQTQSFLAQQADFVLNTTVSKEACPNNLAPTSSTTAQMVMGDALAVCLMELRGFNGEDFARFHPGGNLGKRLYLRVKDLYIHNERPAISPEASLKEIILSISGSRLGVTAVIDQDEQILGVITDGDLRRMLEKEADLHTVCAADIMTRNPKQVEPTALAIKALDLLRKHDITQLVVADEQQHYLGVLHLHDLLKEGLL
ncbi:KpsF/GutQ family sugar-phosphate isomerase [Flavihumibacter sp. CACIAM 22H1]|uniref:KpsF/GutQ family sugar-phosphate isomerase n=1 Tax=Flavihumibacter sp. CACIAM 22H1 TaxID=1812911 RepID=UPI0007A841CF|nr:KpsF/GutQ family sugar-phosphate isomerase [Flavihumibacter sp. CACIAM 22H1]KYP13072.1 MAG: D-arabinose 5-phosphate isomerase [Flavihumibacter sp. CACIAM 22H1]